MLEFNFNAIQKCLAGICLLIIFASTPALAELQTITHGKSLLLSCQQAIIALDQGLDALATHNQNEAFLCMAFLSGLITSAEHANELAKLRFSVATEGRGNQQNFNLYCFNWQLSYHKIARIVLEFGRNQPQYQQRPAHELALRALQTTFPCR
jgi:hypothetical protein